MNDTLLWLLGTEQNSIPYRPSLAKVTGSITSAVLLQQICYWHKKVGRAFYKFKSPNKNLLYRVGDSWIEELGMGMRQFMNARDTIGTLYNTEKEVRDALLSKTDLKHCVIYFVDKKSNLTWYYLNLRALNVLMSKVKEVDEETHKKIQEAKYGSIKDPIFGDNTEEHVPSDEKARPYNRDYFIKNITSGDIKPPEVKIPKEKKKTHPTAHLFRNAPKLSKTFELPSNVLNELIGVGYEEVELLQELSNFIKYYTEGKGWNKRHYDWVKNFKENWVESQYKWGRIKKNGKLYRASADEERIETLRRQATTDLFADIHD